MLTRSISFDIERKAMQVFVCAKDIAQVGVGEPAG